MSIDDEIIGKKCDYEFIIDILEEQIKNYVGNNIEIESRLGLLIDTFTGERLRIASLHPVILKNSLDFRFVSGVDFDDFEKIKDLFKEKESKKTNDTTCSLKNIRKTICNGKETFIRKDRKKTLNIYLPDKRYDLRISIASEIKHPYQQIQARFLRLRARETFQIENLQFDLTTVTEVDKGKNKEKKIYEFETEMIDSTKNLNQFLKTSLIFGCFNK